MRILPFAGLALTGLLLSHTAHAACDTVLSPEVRSIDAAGTYCLAANRSAPIEVRADNVELDCRGRTLSRPSNSPGFGTGVLLRGDNLTVRNCRFEGWQFSVLAEQFLNVQILNNTFIPEGPAITAYGSDRPEGDGLRVIGNRVLFYGSQNGAEQAIGIWHSPRAVLTNNVVAGFMGHAALRLDRSPDAQLTGNQLLDLNEGGSVGVELIFSPRARVVHNTVILRRGVNAHGLSGASEATCIENILINAVHSGLEGCVVTRYNVEQINNGD